MNLKLLCSKIGNKMIFNIKNVTTNVIRKQVEIVYDIINQEALDTFLSKHKVNIQSIVKDRKLQMSLSSYKEIEKELSSMVNIESILYKATPGDIESAFSYQKNVCEARVRAYATNVLGLKKFRYGLDDVSVSESSMYDYGCETEEPFIVTVDYKYYIK